MIKPHLFIASLWLRFVLGLLVVMVTCDGYANNPSSQREGVSLVEGGRIDTIGQLVFKECDVADASGRFRRRAGCASLSVPEDYDQPNGTRLSLFIVRLASHKPVPYADAVTLLAGGPGGAASDNYLNLEHAFGKLLKHRDIYLIDQRGTGRSERFDCDESNMPGDLALQLFDPVIAQKTAFKCLADFQGDPRYYTTSVAVKDLESVRAALGVSQWNIYGASYGTRVALHYLRRYPDNVRSLILDAVVHPELPLGPAVAVESQRALDQLVQNCQKDSECHKAFPDLDAGLKRLLAQLKKQPVDIQFENFTTGRIEPMTFTYNHLVGFIRLTLYQTAGVSMIPVLLHEAYKNNNFSPLARKAINVQRQMSKAIALGMHFSVACTEDQAFVSEDDISPAVHQSYMGTSLVEVSEAFCRVWPRGLIDPDFKLPVKAEHPVLLLSGSVDPITPPAYADAVAKHLPNSLHLVNENQGHGQASVGCTPTIMAKFIEQAAVDLLQTDCLKKQKADPFFINFNGPSP